MVDSSSTLAAVEAQYDDNADWREERSLLKAKAFAQACRILIRRYKSSGTAAGMSYGRDMGQMASELASATTWIGNQQASADGGSVRRLDFRDARQ